jgi:hypothetical protein
MDKRRVFYRILSVIGVSALLFSTLGVAQPRAQSATPAPVAAPSVPSDRDVAETQSELIRLLRLSPTLTTVVSHDPSLLSNQDYVAKNNPQLAAFLAGHPDVARNPDYYLFSHLKHADGEPDEALERAVWPDVYRQQNQPSSLERIWSDLVPLLAFACGLTALIVLVRMLVENRRWSRIFKTQSEVHGKLIERFTNNQELAAYIESDAGKKFLEASPIPMGLELGRRVPSAVARVLTPLQAGIVMVLLGAGLLSLQQAGPDTQIPMRILGTLVLAPGLGFIISAGVSWFLASRLGLMPETPQNRQDSQFDTPSAFKDRQ